MRRANRLSGQNNPYLLQHAHNPVDWYPWGEEAFERARREDKPIFLSVGYSTCHWCHVMERESFEDPEIAAQLNAAFISIKVDREERPDVDRVYMAFVQASTGHGGWPMSVWLTPALKPFVGGTYFPPEQRHGHPGFGHVIEQIARAWAEEREEIERSSEHITQQLRTVAVAAGETIQTADAAILERGFEAFRKGFDRHFGGFGGSPKFPRPAGLSFLLRHHLRTGDEEALNMVCLTLLAMARGGIHDHLGGGFHRYAVDRAWHVPHFEKMLYDQAQLATSYLEAHQLTGDDALAAVARGVLDYVLRDLTDETSGAFFCAEDADSLVEKDRPERREGAFYVWSWQEIATHLGEAAPLFCYHYEVRREGNADDPHGELAGANVLHATHTAAETGREFGIAAAEVEQVLGDCGAKLVRQRDARPRPHLDDKVLCGWNGMMIAALARGYAILGEQRYLQAARIAATFATKTLYDAGQQLLYRRYRGGETAHRACAEDYAQLVDGLIELYQADLDVHWLQLAEQLTERLNELFWDNESAGYFASSADDASVLLRLKDDHDGAEPAASSTAACNLLRLAAMLDRPDWQKRATDTVQHFSVQLQGAPEIMPQMLVALDMLHHPPVQVVVVGERGEQDVEAMLRGIRRDFLPNMLVLLADGAFKQAYGARLPHVAHMHKLDGKATAHLCRNRVCAQPTTDPQQLIEQLRATSR